MIIDWKGVCFCSYSTSKPFTIRPGSTGTMSLSPRRPSLCSGPSRCPYLPSGASVERCQSLTSSECWEGKVVHQSGTLIFCFHPVRTGSAAEDLYVNYKGFTILTHFRQRLADKRTNFGGTDRVIIAPNNVSVDKRDMSGHSVPTKHAVTGRSGTCRRGFRGM